MLLNMLLIFLAFGWMMNATLYQARSGLNFNFWSNFALGAISAEFLIVRLS